MANLSTKYMGLTLRNPLIVGSSGLTNSIEHIKEIAEKGAGAVVLKSIFEEQIRYETDKLMLDWDNESMKPMLHGFNNIMDERSYDYAEAYEYLSNFAKEHTLANYLKFIQDAKKAVDIPIIASVNCNYSYNWHFFAKKIQEAGADALELNVFVLPSDFKNSGTKNEEIYMNIIENVMKYVTIPISLKVSYYFSGLANKLVELSHSGIKGMVLFNRPYSPDIDINKMEITAGNIFSSHTEYSQTLRWVGLLSGRLGCDIAASTGIHNYQDMIKQILAGANVVQITSVLYKFGFNSIMEMLEGLQTWMAANGFETIEDFRGKLSQSNIEFPAAYERVQFMKLYSKIE